MAKVSPNSITSLDQDWGNDESVSLPFSGQAVQAFIKQYLGAIAKACYYDGSTNTLYFFMTEEDKESYIQDPTSVTPLYSETFNYSSELKRIYLSNTGETTQQTATNVESLILSQDFAVQTKVIGDSEWVTTNDGVIVKAFIDKGATGNYTQIMDATTYIYGQTIELEVRPLLATGTNRIKFTYVAESDSSITATLVYTITMSEMYIEIFDDQWAKAIVEGDSSNYMLGGYKIVGAVSKVLHMDIYSCSSGTLIGSFVKSLGTTQYASSPYYYTFGDGTTLKDILTESGTYYCDAYLVTTSGSLESQHVSYNFMYVASGESATAQLVCINNKADFVYNYATSSLCDYAIYNKGLSTGDPDVTIYHVLNGTSTKAYSATLSGVTTGESHSLEYALEWITNDITGLQVMFNITLGDSVGTGTVDVDNSLTYPPTSDYDFYVNSSSRSNADANKENLVNVKNEAELTPTWKTINRVGDTDYDTLSWTDGIDGWTVDDEGRSCLLLRGGSSMELPYSAIKFLSGSAITFEIAYKILNVSDYDENVITIALNPTEEGFKGLRIKPTNITVHSDLDTTSTNDSARGTNVNDEEFVHLAITISPSTGSTPNLVTGYINGCKNFQIDASGANWNINAPLVIGAERSDVCIYLIRKYSSALEASAIENNYVSSLTSVDQRKAMYDLLTSCMEEARASVDYEAVKNGGYNFFVLEMTDDTYNGVPSMANGWGKSSKGTSNLEMHYGEHPEWDFKVEGIGDTAGQGTTSMNYYRWNIRWRLDKSKTTPSVAYLESRTVSGGSYSYEWKDAASSKTVYFDGEGNHPACKRITAKINMASSMQSHKIGATRAYNDLHDALVGYNEAQQDASDNGNPVPVVAVYQYPAFGFELRNGTYSFIGLFTIGPDKGDKPSFGFDNSTIKGNLLSMEGTDHSQRLVQFRYPWNDNVVYDTDTECLSIQLSDSVEKAWEVGICNLDGTEYEPDTDKDGIYSALAQEFKPAYDLAYQNNILLFGIDVDDNTYGTSESAILSAINADVNTFQATQYDNRFTYADMQFFIVDRTAGTANLYYYDVPSGAYVKDHDLASDTTLDLTATMDSILSAIKEYRITTFKASAENYWDVQEAIFHLVYCLIFGAKDNFGKNSYPYKMGKLSDGGRWRWRQDDLDTILDIDNSGGATAPYYMEFIDDNNGTVYFSGGNSVFWNLIYESYWSKYYDQSGTEQNGIKAMGAEMLSKMSSVAGGSNTFDGCVAYLKKYYWENAQEYFPQSAYNADASFKYETAWLDTTHVQSTVPPLTQSLGNHYLAEELWVRRRVIYMMSLFQCGPYGDVSDSTLGVIAFRPVGALTLELQPALMLYPGYAIGQAAGSTQRTDVDEYFEVSATGGNDTTHYIMASNMLTELGNLGNISLSTVVSLTLNGKKLRDVLIGGEDATPTTNIPGVVLPNNACLETFDIRNASSISGLISFASCTRLAEIYMEGSGATASISDGALVQALHLSEKASSIKLIRLAFLSDFSVGDYSSIESLWVSGCDSINGIDLLCNCADAEGSKLDAIRIVWNGTYDATLSQMETVVSLLSGNYHGLDSSGTETSIPVLEGDIAAAGMYTSTMDALELTDEEELESGLVRARSAVFGQLYVIYDESKIYIVFADSNVESICVSTWGDGTGLTLKQAAAVTTLSTTFKGKTAITSFDELKYFTNLKSIAENAFSGCTALTSVTLPDTLTTIQYSAFYGCTALTSVTLPDTLTTIGNGAFSGCTALTSVTLPDTLTTIGNGAFYGCTALTSVTLPATTPPTLDNTNAFSGCSALTAIYVPADSVDDYKAATNWSSYASKIQAIEE